MAAFKITHRRKGCIGCGICATLCPQNWELKKDGKASPNKTELASIGCNQKAADACPVHVIAIARPKAARAQAKTKR